MAMIAKQMKLGFMNQKLKTEQSPKGEAYRTLVGASRHSSIDINKDDDVFNVHNDFLSNEKNIPMLFQNAKQNRYLRIM